MQQVRLTQFTNLFKLILTLTGSAFLVLSCTKPAKVQEHAPLRISHSPWPTFDLFFLAQERGYFDREEKLNVKFHPFTEMHDSRRAFENRNVDIAMLSPYEVLLTRNAGADPVMFLVMDYSDGGDGIVARKEIRKLSDLKGKKIGVEMGTVAHFVLYTGLKKAGLKLSDVTVLNLGNNDLSDAFKAGKIDAAVTWEPFLGQIAKAGGNILFTSKEIPGSIPSVLVVHRDVYEKRSDELKKLVRIWFKSLEALNVDREKALRFMAKSQGMSYEECKEQLNSVRLATIEDVRRYFGTRRSPASPESISVLERNTAELKGFLVEQNLLKAPADPAKMVGSNIIED